MNSDRLDAAGLLARFAALHPVAATATGIHDHDGAWDGVGPAADARVVAWVDEETARLKRIAEADLDRDDRADRDLALATLAAIRFERTEIRTTAWDPLNTVATVGGGLFPLIARTFGSRERRAEDELRGAADAARAAAERFTQRLRDEVLPRSAGEGRYGAARYDRALRHTLFGSHDRAAVQRAAEREFTAVRERIIQIAREIAPHWIGEAEAARMERDPHRLVGAVLHAIGGEHSAAADLLDRCREETARCEAFIKRTGLLLSLIHI